VRTARCSGIRQVSVYYKQLFLHRLVDSSVSVHLYTCPLATLIMPKVFKPFHQTLTTVIGRNH